MLCHLKTLCVTKCNIFSLSGRNFKLFSLEHLEIFWKRKDNLFDFVDQEIVKNNLPFSVKKKIQR